MCRFVAYLGREAVTLNEILDKPENSLISQSRKAREGRYGLNADGFGIGWYDQSINPEPGLFKSVQPAWNDQNLRHLAAKVRSNCFLGHVRASTVGDVNTVNCHPFAYKQFLFVHNGTIRGFEHIRRPLLQSLSNEKFEFIKGQTDSEHFFAMLMDLVFQQKNPNSLEHLYEAFMLAIQKIQTLQQQLETSFFTRLNTVLTDGRRMIATRYISATHLESLSLYYAMGEHLSLNEPQSMLPSSDKSKLGAILVASEQLNDCAKEWQEIPVNHMMLVDEDFSIEMRPI